MIIKNPRSVFTNWKALFFFAFWISYGWMPHVSAARQSFASMFSVGDLQAPSADQNGQSDWDDDLNPMFDLAFETATRPWVGKTFWANPMEDWQLVDGIAINTHSGGDRNLAVLTMELSDRRQDFEIRCNFYPQSDVSANAKGFVGFQVGLRGQFDDYRDSAIYGTGLNVGVNANGRLFIGGVIDQASAVVDMQTPFELLLRGRPAEDQQRYQLHLTAQPISGDRSGENAADPEASGDALTTAVELSVEDAHQSWLPGLVSVIVSAEPPIGNRIRNDRPAKAPAIAQKRGGDWRWGVAGLSVAGEKFDHHPDRAWGPILWTQYSLSERTLIMTAQFAPVDAEGEAVLRIEGQELARSRVDRRSRLARFVIAEIDANRDLPYEIVWGEESFTASIAADPSGRDQVVVAALSCNDSTGFPHQALVQHVSDHQPDLIAFLGDQLYEPIGGFGHLLGDGNDAYDDRVSLCYLRKFYLHGWSWAPLLSTRPSITIPDDHDVLHGNIWGAGGKLADRSLDNGMRAQDSGGYKLSLDNVNVVHQTQTGNLPSPTDGGAEQENGVSVYFTRWIYAGVDMAILADRQFKSAPKAILPDAQIANGWPQNLEFQHPQIADPKVFDIEGVELLGQRQESFLADWAQSPDSNANWRLVFSQSPFACVHTLPADAVSDGVVPSLPVLKPGEYPENDIVKIDFDANGWPQSRRDFAVHQITKAGAVHIAGDQHLGMTGQHGTLQHDDGAWWITVPAIANLWPRRWFPRTPGEHPRPGDPAYTGQFLDGFANKVTIHAVANPFFTGRNPSRLYDRAVGYAILTLQRDSGHVTMENWPYTSSPANPHPDNVPYQGWPITIDPSTHQRVR